MIGHSTGTKGFAGVFGESTGGPGVSAHSTNSVGVDAKSDNGPAALRAVHAGEGPGVLAEARNNGVHGRSIGTKGFAGVFGESTGGPGVSAPAPTPSASTPRPTTGRPRFARSTPAAVSPASSTAMCW